MGAAGRRGELKKTSYFASQSWFSDDESCGDGSGNIVRDPELWFDYWSEELVETYHCLIDESNRRGFPIFDRLAFPVFVDFAYSTSSKTKPNF